MNTKNYKILFSLSISSAIAITSLLFVLNYYPSTTFQEIETNTFFNKDFDINEKKIFIFGASQTGRINSIHVDDIISKNSVNHSVYNLAYDGDLPKTRHKLLSHGINQNCVPGYKVNINQNNLVCDQTICTFGD